jgi:dUTP pyrophosphatase
MYVLEILPTSENASQYYKTGARGNENAGFDLYVPMDVTFAPNEKKLVSMQVKAKMVEKAFGREGTPVHYWMPPRSSISKTGLLLLNSIGVIDASYRGELMAYLWNTTNAEVNVKKGDRLVQIVGPNMGHIEEVVVVDFLDVTERGEGGFGSTGK